MLYSQVKISGTVKDNKGIPVVGANVVVKGTMNSQLRRQEVKRYFRHQSVLQTIAII